ncbi:DUF927 domain-containing protein [Methylobacterium terricola]|uniref:DUF927 domain-containing protein n=1 Tax=Methylobacterium terricola TaxID=2583531 RepID=A0A5C4LHM7_9HYPH|nr:DUF927 domain-containing protein [Methylobacterium terricola]TNC12675.1 DUF927 domain-containing protein [Methylobacterium terricola]
MIDLRSIARALGGEFRNGQVHAPGPGHSATDRSLSVRLSDDGTDIVLHSFAGDDPIACKDYVRVRAGLPRWEPQAGSGPKSPAAMSRRARQAASLHSRQTREEAPETDSATEPRALGEEPQDLIAARAADEASAEIVLPVPEDAPEPSFRHSSLGLPSRTWTYPDAAGRVLGYVARFDPPGERKQFAPLTLWCENGVQRWRWKTWPRPRPLYGLDFLAARPTASVIITEGEKAADEARRIFPNSVVVASPGGAEAAGAADWRPLKGRQVMIWPDADDPGHRYATQVKAELAAIGASTVTLVNAMSVAATAPSGEIREVPKGWDAADALAEGYLPEAIAALVLANVERAEPPPAYTSFHPYTMNSDGLIAEEEKGPSKARSIEEVWCSDPFEVIGLARDPHGIGWSKWLRWNDRDGRRHVYMVADAALHGDVGAVAAELANRGLTVSRNARAHLCNYLNQVRVNARVTTVNRTGWHVVGERQVFVLPDQVVGQPDNETVLLVGAAAAPYSSRGTLDDWREGIGRLSVGHSRIVLAIATALAGPLVHLVGGEGGGLNFYGQSSKGKTTTLRAAASVWGRGSADPGFVRSWRATANAQEATAAIVTDTLLCLDEIGVAEGRDAAAAVYQLASGIGKGRAARDGSIRNPTTWRVLTLSTGEIPMAAKIAEDRQRKAYAGQSVRLLDIPADAGCGFGVFDHAGEEGDPARLADAIKSAAVASFGTAGPAFVRGLVEHGLEEITRNVIRIMGGFVEQHVPADADGQVRRAASRLGIVAAAGEVAIMFGIVPWQRGEAVRAAARALADWIATRGGSEPAEIREAIGQVRRFFEAHGESRFEPMEDSDAKPVHNRTGWRRGTGSDREWLVLPELWKAEVCAGLDAVATARILAERGMLRRDPQGKLQRSERTPYKSGQRVYVVTADLFEGGDDGR